MPGPLPNEEPRRRPPVVRIYMRWACLTFALAAAAFSGRGADTALLRQVADRWFDERDRWAFTQVVREYEGPTLKQERVEHYDPSRRELSRWQLVSIDGRRPTPPEWAEWTKHKNKLHKRTQKPLTDYFDYAHARVLEESADTVRYELPLKNNVEWLFPIEKVELIVTVNKHGPGIEQVQARIGEPFHVALGLARVMDIDLDVQLEPPASLDPAQARASGTGHAVVAKRGQRVEYFWKDFKRVTPRAEEEE